MALNQPFLVLTFTLFITITLSLAPPTTSTRTTPIHGSSESSTAVLDVSSSLHQAHQVLSYSTQLVESSLKEETHHKPTSSSSFSVQLHPRGTVLNEKHRDYKNLVLSRLARDSARVNSLTLKLKLALNGVNKSDLHPTQMDQLLPEALSTPVSSGTGQGSGEYFSRVGVGQPAKPFYMVLDTGSDVN